MRRNLDRATGLAILLLLACQPPGERPGTGSTPVEGAAHERASDSSPTVMNPDEAALQELTDRFVRGVRTANPDTMASVYSATAEVFAPAEEKLLLGQGAIRAHFAKRLANLRVTHYDTRRSHDVVTPEIAYGFGVWDAVTHSPEDTTPDTSAGHVTTIYRRDGAGPWVVAHEHVSVRKPPFSPPDSLTIPF